MSLIHVFHLFLENVRRFQCAAQLSQPANQRGGLFKQLLARENHWIGLF